MPHMGCANHLAEKWFPLVIQSAIAGDSVYKPLKALKQLKQIDWAAEGLCLACVRKKRRMDERTNRETCGRRWTHG
ncbi:hypothetical protein JVU11DRAFT_9361 [Chiua virens]|nr:hypothetical protein JVU11DRAFT_9129 [Chiua virens]KAG9310753.1 hypothetical protein JVU11DRAFT_9361 [Chiua virens]